MKKFTDPLWDVYRTTDNDDRQYALVRAQDEAHAIQKALPMFKGMDKSWKESGGIKRNMISLSAKPHAN